MANVKKWDDYTGYLALLGQWKPPDVDTLGRDVIEQVRLVPSTGAVSMQAVRLLKNTWATLPPNLRKQAMDQLSYTMEQLSTSWESISDELGDIPIVNIVMALIQGFVMIGKAAKGVAEIKRYASNFEHGNAQYETCEVVLNPRNGMYTRVQAREFAQYVKVRTGGDFDRKPCFSRKGLMRDAIFLGTPSPDDSGNCRKKMRRGRKDSYGPFSAKCGRTLGISALMWPWWSAAYEPRPLPRWEGSPPGAPFQAGPSADTNGLLVGAQMKLITDPAFNLRASLADLTTKCATFFEWWDSNASMIYPMKNGKIISNIGKKIDKRKNPQHVPSKSAAAYWYVDSHEQIVPYENQAGASLHDWGIRLPDGDPANLGVTLAQQNAVVSMRAAFAERRLATLRKPRLVEAIIADYGLSALDAGAREAILFAKSSPEQTLPYPGKQAAKIKQAFAAIPTDGIKPKQMTAKMELPGGLPRKVVAGRIPPLREPSKKKGSALPLVAGAAAVVFFMAKK